MKRPETRSLSLAPDAPTPVPTVKPNPQGVVKGYDPYDSGRLERSRAPRKKDLRRLSEWMKLRRQAGRTPQR